MLPLYDTAIYEGHDCRYASVSPFRAGFSAVCFLLPETEGVKNHPPPGASPPSFLALDAGAFFPDRSLPELLAALKTGFHWDGRINWTPFAAFRQALTIARRTGDPSFFLLNIPGNILIFLPLGLLPPLLWGKMEKLWKTALFGFGISLFIEAAQLILPRGTDVDDLLLNTFGTLLGYALFALIRKRFPNFPARCRHRPAAERNAL